MGKAIVEFEYIFHSSSATSSPPMHFAFAVVAASIGLAAAQTPAWIWNCGSGQGSIQSCNNACWAINCGSRFSRGSIYHPDRPNTNLHRIESGVKPNPNPCNDGWPRYKGWRRAGDRTGGGLPAKTADEFPLAALREGGARAKLRCVNGPDNSSGGSKLSAFSEDRIGALLATLLTTEDLRLSLQTTDKLNTAGPGRALFVQMTAHNLLMLLEAGHHEPSIVGKEI